MLNQLRYFKAVVECKSFTEAAEICHISQSAISQQIQSLEQELGVKLLMREKRQFQLTPAGEHFYYRSLQLLEDYDKLTEEVKTIDRGDKAQLNIGVLLTYGGSELQLALADFSRKYPDVDVRIMSLNHDEIYQLFTEDKIDIALSGQRRAFHSDFNNIILKTNECYIEIDKENPIASQEKVTPEDLKNIPMIVIAHHGQEEIEAEYYKSVFGITSTPIFTNTIKDARLMVVTNQGFLPVEGAPVLSHFAETIERVPFYKGKSPMDTNLCLYWSKDNSGYYIEEFADILESKFQ